jgi:hypothetical protein
MKLAEFAKWVVQESCLDGFGDLDGFDIHKKAVECEIILPTRYDPIMHGDSDDAEPGDDWYVLNPELKKALSDAVGP